ncbi:MAG: hypothetical protein AAF517_20915, partial [Planctomycetota bacterium]
MTPEQYRRIEELFEPALSRSGDDRARFLDDECGDDRELRERLESMLRSVASDELPHGLPERIGPY